MCSSLYDMAFVHDDDLVGIEDGGKTVGYNQAGASFHEPGHSVLDILLGTGVDAGCRLVQNQDVRIGEKGPADGQELLLAL